MWKRVIDWWDGEYIPYENDPNSGVVFIGGTMEKHWTSTVTRKIWLFFKKEWKWVSGTVLTISGLIIAYKAVPL